MNRQYIKQQAKSVIKNSGMFFYLLTIAILVLSLLSAIPIIGILAFVAIFLCSFLLTKNSLKAARGEFVNFDNMMDFKELKLYIKLELYMCLKCLIYMIPTYIGILCIGFVKDYYNDLFNILLVLIGIILIGIGYIYCFYKMLGFTFAPYIFFDYDRLTNGNGNNQVKCKDLLQTSELLMKNHKGNYIIFVLSFIPWLLLCSITCGLAYIYVIPYMQLSTTVYYLERLKQDN